MLQHIFLMVIPYLANFSNFRLNFRNKKVQPLFFPTSRDIHFSLNQLAPLTSMIFFSISIISAILQATGLQIFFCEPNSFLRVPWKF